MDLIIQSVGFNLSATMDNFIIEKMIGLNGDKIVRASVTLYKDPSSNTETNYCEMQLEESGNDHFVKKYSTHFETAINECVEILSQMIIKTKGSIYQQAC